MPKFDKVAWQTPVKKIFDKKKDKKQLLADLKKDAATPALASMTKNHDEWEKFLMLHKAKTKELVEAMEVRLKSIELEGKSPASVKLAEEQVAVAKRIASYAEILRLASEEYAKAFEGDGFRGNKLSTALKDAGYFTQAMSIEDFDKEFGYVTKERESTITADTRLGAERQRVVEYVDRANILAKQSLLAASKAKTSTRDLRSEFKVDNQKMLDQLRDGTKGLEDILDNLNVKLERLFRYAADPKLGRAAVEKQIVSTSSTFENDRKGLSGGLRTAILSLEAMQKRYGHESFAKKDLLSHKERLFAVKDKLGELGPRLKTFDTDIVEVLNKTYG